MWVNNMSIILIFKKIEKKIVTRIAAEGYLG